MLSAFSWGEFVQGMLMTLVCYYLVVGMLFYRAEMRQFLSHYTFVGLSNKNKDVSKRPDVIEIEKADKERSIDGVRVAFGQTSKITPAEEISDIYIKLEEAVQDANVKKLPRPELLGSLQIILRKYKIGDKAFVETVNGHIQSQLTIYSFKPLNDEELDHLWLY